MSVGAHAFSVTPRLHTAAMSIYVVAANQYGLVSHEQARKSGLSTRQIGSRVDSGLWVRVVRGVYRIAGAPMTWQQTALAACLAGPESTVASHLTAAALSGLGRPPLLPHVTVPKPASARLSIATVHRADLVPTDCVRLFGIPCTDVVRTVLDCCPLLGDRALAAMVDDVLHRKLTTVDALDPAGGWPGRKGVSRLRRAMDAWAGDIEPGSPAEIRMQRQLMEWGYPRPVRQHPVRDSQGRLIGKLDLAWPDRLIGIEYDSDKWHDPRRWRHDESRHGAVVKMGWILLHGDKADLRAGERQFRKALERAWTTAGVCANRRVVSVGAHTSPSPLQNTA
jgi:hypothetical protein